MMDSIERNYEYGKIKFEDDVMRIASVINQYKTNFTHFKIGKAGETAEERYRQDDYHKTYDGIIELYASSSKTLVDKMEATLIDIFIDDFRCDNDKGGKQSINDTMKESGRYIVYVVYKKRISLFS